MVTLDKSQDKIQRICEILKNETLGPAQKEKEQILLDAEKRAQEIVREAELEARKILDQQEVELAHKRNVFESSLAQAAKQSMESLRQEFEHKFFNQAITHLLEKPAQDPAILASLIKAVILAIEKQGLAVNLAVEIPKAVSAKSVNELLGKEMLNVLANGSVDLGSFNGGIKVQLKDKRMILDITGESLKELLADYLRADFRKMVFAGGQ